MDFQIILPQFHTFGNYRNCWKTHFAVFHELQYSFRNPIQSSFIVRCQCFTVTEMCKVTLGIWFLKRSSLGKNAFKIANISEIRFFLPYNFTFNIFRCSVMSLKKASSRRHLGSTIKSTSSFFLSLSEIHLFPCEVKKTSQNLSSAKPADFIVVHHVSMFTI